MSIDDLHDETKIPLGLLEDFESTALFGHSQFNRVYLRSFVRTYAQVIGISPERAMEALEMALDGQYDERLAVEYLGAKPSAPPVRPEGPGAPSEPGEPKGRTERSKPAAGAAPPRREEPVSTGSAPGAGSASAAGSAAAARGKADEDWTAASPPGRRAAAKAPVYREPRTRPSTSSSSGAIWGVALVGLVVLAGVGWFVFGRGGGDETAEPAPAVAMEAPVHGDTVATPLASGRDPSTIPTLGDTMAVWIVAADGKLDPIRVTVDDDLRRPYWLEQGDSMVFRPRQRIVIEELLDNIRLSVLGERYPTNRRDAQNRIVVTRDSVQAYLRSLAAGTAPPGAR